MSKKPIKRTKYHFDKPRKRVYVYVPEKQIEILKDLSAEQHKSVSAIINELIEEKLETIIKLDLDFSEVKNGEK